MACAMLPSEGSSLSSGVLRQPQLRGDHVDDQQRDERQGAQREALASRRDAG